MEGPQPDGPAPGQDAAVPEPKVPATPAKQARSPGGPQGPTSPPSPHAPTMAPALHVPPVPAAGGPHAPRQPGRGASRTMGSVRHLVRTHPVVAVAGAYLVFKILVLWSSWLLLQRPAGFLRQMSMAWDGDHYLRVARHGFDPDGTGAVTLEYHWPPLFPIVVRAIGAGDMAPFIANGVAGLAAVVVVTRLMGWRAGLFFALFPTWVAYSSFGYTEGLFVLLAATALLWWRDGQSNSTVAAGLAAGGAIAARYAGLFPFLTFGAWALRRDPRRAMLFAAPVGLIGIVLLAWHWSATGTPLAYIEASKPWGRTFGWPWQQIDWIFHGWFTAQPAIREPKHFWLLRNLAFMVPSFFGFALLWRHDRALFAFSAGTVLVTLFAAETQILGIPRYLIAAFPAVAIIGLRIRDTTGWIAYAAAAAIGGCWIVTGHLRGFVS